MNSFNSNLSQICFEIIVKFLNFKLNDPKIEFKNLENILRSIEQEFDEILFYNDRLELEKCKIYTQGFLLDIRFTLNYINQAKEIRALFLLKETQFQKEDITFELKSNVSNKINKILALDSSTHFSAEFLSQLKKHKINLLFCQGNIEEFKKSQLSFLKCSLICYLEKSKIEYLTEKLKIKPLYEKEFLISEENILEIDRIESIADSENLNYFKVNCLETRISSILFCSPIKINFSNFKIYFLKCLKSLLNLLTDGLILKCSFFELNSIKICKNLQIKFKDSLEDFVLWKYLESLFEILLFKLENFKTLKELHEFDQKKNLESIEFFDVFQIKFKCLLQSLHFSQSILNIDSICFVKSIELCNLKLESDDDDSNCVQN